MGATKNEDAASEKLEIIRLVEESRLSARRTLAELRLPHTTFYRSYNHIFASRGWAAGSVTKAKRAWNRIPNRCSAKSLAEH